MRRILIFAFILLATACLASCSFLKNDGVQSSASDTVPAESEVSSDLGDGPADAAECINRCIDLTTNADRDVVVNYRVKNGGMGWSVKYCRCESSEYFSIHSDDDSADSRKIDCDYYLDKTDGCIYVFDSRISSWGISERLSDASAAGRRTDINAYNYLKIICENIIDRDGTAEKIVYDEKEYTGFTYDFSAENCEALGRGKVSFLVKDGQIRYVVASSLDVPANGEIVFDEITFASDDCKSVIDGIRSGIDGDIIMTFRYLSTSMSPAIKQGETVSAYAVAPEELKEGDVIVYYINDDIYVYISVSRVTGRYTGESGEVCGVTVKGDNSGAVSSSVLFENIIGIVRQTD